MKASEYQKLAMRTNDGESSKRLWKKVDTSINDYFRVIGKYDIGGVVHGCLGLAGEVGEFNDIVKKTIFHEKDFDEQHAKKELGDCLWYIALICDSFRWDMEEIMQMNVDKLKARYPEGFSTELANNRKEGDI